jgi:putative ABC transport system permease protein
MPDAPLRISIRTARVLGSLVPELVAALHGLDPRLTFAFRRVEEDLAESMGEERLLAALASFAGIAAVLLSAVGLYGVTSYAVARRRSEIGIRLALGGQPHAVLRAVLGQIGFFVAAGAAVGLAATVWMSRFAAPLLYGLEPQDPPTLAAATLTLAAVAALAAGIPAWRAVRIDPAQVLREN